MTVQSECSKGSLEGLLGSTLLDPSLPLLHSPGLLDQIRKNVVVQDTGWLHRPVSSHWEDKERGSASVFFVYSHLAGRDYAAAAVAVPPRRYDAVDVVQSCLDAAESPAGR